MHAHTRIRGALRCVRAFPAAHAPTAPCIASLHTSPPRWSGEHATTALEAAHFPYVSELYTRVCVGDRVALARAITLVESTRPDHRAAAGVLLDMLLTAREDAQARLSQFQHVGAPGSRLGPHPRVCVSGGGGGGVSGGETSSGSGSGSGSASVNREARRGVGATAGTQHRLPSFRIGFAGPPGAGKSSLVEALGVRLLEEGHRVAVVAVDPSSSRTGGSILGDKTRMPRLAADPRAFVRPSPTRGALGGVARHTNDVILLCEGGGYDIVMVESVGLGQSEVLIDETVDMVVLVVPPAGGDELQGVKRGIVEVADLLVVNKADGALLPAARHAAAEYRRALQLVRWKHHDWQPRVRICSALEGLNLPELIADMNEFRSALEHNGALRERRQRQARAWMWDTLDESLRIWAHQHPAIAAEASALEEKLVNGYITPRRAAGLLFDQLMQTAGDRERDQS